MRFPERRRRVISRSMALGHCICNIKTPCPCVILTEQNLCPCAGERPDPPEGSIRLTQSVRKAGCASKIGQADLQRVLSQLPVVDDPRVLVGVAAGDDAGIYQLDGDSNLVQTVDVFTPVVDDAYTFGRICAANSVSDIYAMGGKPICALSIIGFPIETLPDTVMTDILRGGIDTMKEAGVAVIGGHSINDEEVKCGFAVTGLIQGQGEITNRGAQPGDVLVLTKPIGTGILTFAAQLERVSDEAVQLASQSMAELNKDAAEWMVEYGAHACTDVTGFSLMGHLSLLVNHSGVSAEIQLADVPLFAEAYACTKADIIPGAVERNLESFGEGVIADNGVDETELSILFDAQTSGGLLIAFPEQQASRFVEVMREKGHQATSIIGRITEKNDLTIKVIMAEPANLVGAYREPKDPPAEKTESKSNEMACCSGGEHASTAEPSIAHSPVQPSSPLPPQATEVPSIKGANAGEVFKQWSQAVNAAGGIDSKHKKLMAIALSIATKCEPCLKHHLESARAQGMAWQDIEEAAWMAIFFAGAPAKMFYEKVKSAVE